MEVTPRGGESGALAAFGYLAGPRINEEIAVPSPVVVIGKGSQADLVVDDDSVSQVHARLEYDAPGGWRLTDLDSTNGTYVEGVRLAPQVPTPLPYGSTVRFGGVRLQFREGAVERLDQARAEFETRSGPAPEAAPRRFRLPVWALVLILLVVGAAIFLLTRGDSPDPVPAGAEGISLLVAPSPSPELP